MQSQFSSMTVSKVEVTAAGQNPASSFCNSMPKGFGFLPTSVRFDPTYSESENSLHYHLVPSPEEILQAPRLRLRGEKMGLQTWGESEPGGIHKQFSAVESMYSGLEDNGQKQLGTRGLVDGIAARTSYEDAHHCFGIYFLSDVEFKGAESSALSAMAQGAVTATNIGMGLLALIPRSHIIIPVIGITGLSFVAGATIVLGESFPTFIPISKHLDLSDPVERQVASAYIAKASAHCEKLKKMIDNTPAPAICPRPLRLEIEGEYYIKKLTPEVYQRGFGLFASHNLNHLDIEIGMHHMIDVLNLVYSSPIARQFAEYPLSIRTPDEASDGCYQIIYRDLTKMGFLIGAPDRMTNETVYNLYVRALTDAVESIHRAGVIHVDLYLSNVMWRYNKGNSVVEIKIIDWDAAHCIDEEKFVDKVEKSLNEYLGRENVNFGVQHDRLYLAVLSLGRDKGADQWQSLASGIKANVDTAFRVLLGIVLQG